MSLLQSITSPLKRSMRGSLSFLPGFTQDLQTYVATIDIDYVQRVSVGVEASSRDHAAQLVRRAYDAGTLFNDTAAMPLLVHAFEPVSPDSPLQLASLEEVDELPASDPSVDAMKCIGASRSLLHFARVIDELCEQAEDPQDRGAAYIGIDVPVDELVRLRKLLKPLEAC